MKKPASKFAKLAQIQPKSQFLFSKNLPPRDFSIMTLAKGLQSLPDLTWICDIAWTERIFYRPTRIQSVSDIQSTSGFRPAAKNLNEGRNACTFTKGQIISECLHLNPKHE